MTASPVSLRLSAEGGEDPAELEAWRTHVRAWVAENVPADWRARMTGAGDEEYVAFQRWWMGRLREGGYLAPHVPKRWGGGGCTLAQQVILAEELAHAGAPQLTVTSTALYHAASTLLAAGTDEQQARHLPAILAGEIWTQGFSEPGAGSDLASLQTRARREGDRYVVNGQKIWSSYATYATHCLLLARTDPDAPKRRGITCFILDMTLPGVQIVPIRQSTGEHEFCEIFLTDVELGADRILGAENDGWRVAQGTLSTERSVFVLEQIERLCVTRGRLTADVAAQLPALNGTPAEGRLRQSLARLYAETEVLRLICYRMLDDLGRHGGAGPESSVIKVMFAETLKRVDELGTTVGGLDAQRLRPHTQGVNWESGDWMVDLLATPAWTVGGGSSEIMRNVIAERVLGLPREPGAA
ncbi:acyl-CoA dehydrogenase family protein [Capillimicrobium parvum]|uniref:Acyl-CoA dehydrogenase FadE17 n=1 Tax=Capillimicrobium parvum TaxID=2884022 RepID=A0A9E7BZQ9_9ACTN|nr:acyl-CoA dehydrogenase family protein [Capillimicrobium parvum]UGS34829.1 Putative acyl-CoA dehydrogenase FadE17 [Capillimicrobium parvum]